VTDLRYEWKFFLSPAEAEALQRRLANVFAYDAHSGPAGYRVCSLYFDTPGLDAYRQKLDGQQNREKFRARVYNGDMGFIRLERKMRWDGLIQKQTQTVDADFVRAALAGVPAPLGCADALTRRLGLAQRLWGLAPRVIVAYHRVVFVAPPDVRISFDNGITASARLADFLRPGGAGFPVLDKPMTVMEIKYGHFLPGAVQALVAGVRAQAQSVSKYALCMGKVMEVGAYVQGG
jgi:hypothetical protein